MNINRNVTISGLACFVLLMATGFAVKPQEKAIIKARWLIGEWQHKTARGILYERWKQTNDSLLSGKSFFLRDKDTVVLETIALKQDRQGLWYIPTVRNQNDGKAVPFRLTEVTASRMVFENPEHDFPQKIMYNRISADSLVAEISGTINGTMKQQRFPMRKSR